jgi:hypothetical protein
MLDIAYCLFQDIAQYIALHEERISKLPRPVFHYSKVGIIPFKKGKLLNIFFLSSKTVKNVM